MLIKFFLLQCSSPIDIQSRTYKWEYQNMLFKKETPKDKVTHT